VRRISLINKGVGIEMGDNVKDGRNSTCSFFLQFSLFRTLWSDLSDERRLLFSLHSKARNTLLEFRNLV
jgi:hypothetical protein